MVSFPLKQKLIGLIGLLLLIGIAYSSSLTASWHLDDIQHILRNEKIHLTRPDVRSLIDTFFANPYAKLYRPLPMASFALNWYAHGADVLGYRITNILIHWLNGVLVYLVVTALLQAPRLENAYRGREIHWIALIAAALWALNPLQIQAVTYIVQRMAAMATLFYLVGLFAYLRYKHAASKRTSCLWMAVCTLAFVMAVLSKENAILFPIGLYLIHTIFYASREQRQSSWRGWLTSTSIIAGTLILGSALFFVARGNPIALLDSLYADRPFTAMQRLLTEPRIVLFYLSLLFFPAPWRLSLSHDVTVSTSLLTPWTTLPAILCVAGAASICMAVYRKWPMVSFAGLFFLLNHGVESTILPLELIFEHRNYLPSLFLFLPLAHGLVRLSDRAAEQRKYGRYLAVGAVCLLIGILCNWTFARNLVWQSQKTLWEYEIKKHPHLARPYHNLAWGHYQSRGKYDEALALYQKALTLKAHTPFEVATTLNNMGRIHYLKNDYRQARLYFERAAAEYPRLKIANYQLVSTLMQLERWQEAMERIDAALNHDESDPLYLKLKAVALSRVGADDKSATLLYKSLQLNPASYDTRAHLSLALSRMGRLDEAARIAEGNRPQEKGSPQLMLVLADIERHKGNLEASDRHLERFIMLQGPELANEHLQSWKNDNLSIEIDYVYYMNRIRELSKK